MTQRCVDSQTMCRAALARHSPPLIRRVSQQVTTGSVTPLPADLVVAYGARCLESLATFEGPTKGQLVGIFEVATDG